MDQPVPEQISGNYENPAMTALDRVRHRHSRIHALVNGMGGEGCVTEKSRTLQTRFASWRTS